MACAVLALVGVTVSGCVRYRAVELSPGASLETLEARRLDGPALRRFAVERAGVGEWPPAAYDLDSLTLVALFYSPDVDVARARWAAARAAAVTAGQRPEPTLSFGEGYNATSTGISPWIPEAVLGLPVETAGKRAARLDEAGSLAEAARLAVLSTAWQVRSHVRGALLELFLAQRGGDLLAQQRRLSGETVAIQERQFEAGEISAAELTRARLAADQTDLAALAAVQRVGQARVALATELGVGTGALEKVTIAFEEMESSDVDLPSAEARRRALTGRADLLAALAEFEASQAALRLEIAKQYPDIEIGAGYQLDQTDTKWTLSISLPLPIRNRNRGPIAEAEARRAAAAAQFMAAQAQVIGELEGALAACRSATAQREAAQSLTDHLAARVSALEAAFRLGDTSRLELIGAQAELVAARLAALEALAAARRAAGALEDAMQRPVETKEWVLETPSRTAQEGDGDDG